MGAQIRRGVILTILLFCDTKNNIPWILNIIKGKFSMTYVYFKHIKHIKLNDKATITTAKDEVWISSWKLLFSGGRDEPSVGGVYRENFFSGSGGWVSKFSATGELPHSSSGQKSTLYGYLINYLILSSKMAAF